MKTYKIPVQYSVYGEIEIEAESLEEAVEYAKENIKDIELPYQPEYIEDSFEINDDMYLIRAMNGECELDEDSQEDLIRD